MHADDDDGGDEGVRMTWPPGVPVAAILALCVLVHAVGRTVAALDHRLAASLSHAGAARRGAWRPLAPLLPKTLALATVLVALRRLYPLAIARPAVDAPGEGNVPRAHSNASAARLVALRPPAPHGPDTVLGAIHDVANSLLARAPGARLAGVLGMHADGAHAHRTTSTAWPAARAPVGAPIVPLAVDWARLHVARRRLRPVRLALGTSPESLLRNGATARHAAASARC